MTTISPRGHGAPSTCSTDGSSRIPGPRRDRPPVRPPNGVAGEPRRPAPALAPHRRGHRRRRGAGGDQLVHPESPHLGGGAGPLAARRGHGVLEPPPLFSAGRGAVRSEERRV